MIPLISAEAGDGAAGCASGSQTCSGTMPAFAPKPITASTNAIDAQNGDSCWTRRLANVKSPVLACSTPKHSRIARAPMCASSRYKYPAWRIALTRWLAITRKYDDSAIVSQATMNAYASSARTTNAMPARNR